MLACIRAAGFSSQRVEAAARSLGQFTRSPAAIAQQGAFTFLETAPAGRSASAGRSSARPRPLTVHRSASGAAVLFNGHLDDAAELAAELGLAGAPAAQLYGAAVDRWEDQADLHLVGDYCAVLAWPDSGRVRLSRSPIMAPPLHYALMDGLFVAASVPRVIFACGVEMRIDDRKLAATMLGSFGDEERGFYEGLRQVPIGSIVSIEGPRAHSRRYYTLANVPPQRAIDDEECVARARALLDKAVANVMAGSAKPGLCLSGGLDSPQVAESMLRQRPQLRLPTYTFKPDPEWDGLLHDGILGDETPLIDDLAARYPRLEPHYFNNAGLSFDERLDEMLLATGVPSGGLTNMHHYHALWRAARSDGCDLMVFADYGNQTFSEDGRWAYNEFLVRGRWLELYRLLRDRPGDSRPLWRRFAAHCVLNNLPTSVIRRVKHVIHGGPMVSAAISPVRRDFAARTGTLEESAQAADSWDRSYARTRKESIYYEFFRGDLESADVLQGFEQLYGITYRAAPAYRPLVEFCWSLPTSQFVRKGETRWLARRMGRGNLPESIVGNRRIGQHSVDWHVRIGRRREEWSAALRRWQDIPEIAERIDIPRMLHALGEGWPETTQWDRPTFLGSALGLPRAIMNARFIALVNGINQA